MASAFLTRSSGLDAACSRGVGATKEHVSTSRLVVCRSSTVARKRSSGGAAADIGNWNSSSKYERIAAFVDAHATPVLPASAATHCFSNADVEQPMPWHNSYDEEAEEGELCDEPHLLQHTQQVSAIAAGHAAALAAASAASTPTTVVHSWSYGSLENPKPWCYSWDEEAEGSFELADCGRQTAQQLRAQRRAALHEARHAARVNRRMRRAQLHPQLGDLEHMQAWVGEEVKSTQQQKPCSIPSVQYQQLLAMVAGDSTHRQYRKPKTWHLTFDEECHGEAPETILGSC